jgi:hypothetical protein
MRPCIWLFAVLALALATCSDDTKPTSDGPVVVGDKGKLPDGAKPPDTGLIYLDSNPSKDGKAWTCTPGAANMCDGFKTQYCLNGACTPCPGLTMDCDRQGTCECAGVCDGTKCKLP